MQKLEPLSSQLVRSLGRVTARQALAPVSRSGDLGSPEMASRLPNEAVMSLAILFWLPALRALIWPPQ